MKYLGVPPFFPLQTIYIAKFKRLQPNVDGLKHRESIILDKELVQSLYAYGSYIEINFKSVKLF